VDGLGVAWHRLDNRLGDALDAGVVDGELDGYGGELLEEVLRLVVEGLSGGARDESCLAACSHAEVWQVGQKEGVEG